MKRIMAVWLCFMMVFSSAIVMVSGSEHEIKPQATIIVPIDYPTIQSAIDNASVGDRIEVMAGTYFEHLKINKTISLVGENRLTTIIDGGGTGALVNISANSVNISGFTIRDWGLFWMNYGILLNNVDNCNIKNNSLDSTSQNGIYLINSNSNIIEYNQVTDVYCGIYLEKSSNNSLRFNDILRNDYGIWLQSSCKNNDVYNNTVSDSTWQALRLSWKAEKNTVHENNLTNSGEDGLFISVDAKYNEVYSNNITENNDYGIHMWGCISNNITKNNISNNGYGFYIKEQSRYNNIFVNNISDNTYGFYIENAPYENLIYHNNIINNTEQAYDFGTNIWNASYPTGGNYWSDYTGVDFNSTPAQNVPPPDGIGDSPYTDIGGGTGAQDNYPLMEPWVEITDTTPPIISSVSVIDITDTSATITWTTNESSDSTVNYSVNSDLSSNSTTYVSNMTTSHSIILTGLASGTKYYFEVSSTDNSGNTATNNNGTNYYSFTTTADITPPVSSLGQINPYWQTTPLLYLTASANDAGGSVINVTLWYRFSSDNTSWNADKSFVLDTSAPWNWTFDYPDGEGYYEFYSIANDTANNTEIAPVTADTSCAYDITQPDITDSSQIFGTTGESYTFQVQVTDNLALDELRVIYWFGSGTETNATMVHTSGDNYEFGINILHSTETLHYQIVAVDKAGNWNSTAIKNVIVTDNDVPVADAGPDQTMNQGATVSFDGSGSTDNVGITNYSWTFDDGVTQMLHGIGPTYVFNTPSTYNLTLNVTDAAGNWDVDWVMITVNDVTNPMVDAGPDQIVNVGTIVTFDGSGSTDNVDIVNYTWTFNDGVQNVTIYGVAPTHNFAAPGNHTVTLTVTDVSGNADMDTMVVTVNQMEIQPPSEGNIGDYWWILLLMVAIIILCLLFFMHKKPEVMSEPEPVLETEICPKCGFDIEKGGECPFCAMKPKSEPPPKPEPKPKLQNEEILERLEKAYKEGKLSEEQYLKNLEKFKK